MRESSLPDEPIDNVLPMSALSPISKRSVVDEDKSGSEQEDSPIPVRNVGTSYIETAIQ